MIFLLTILLINSTKIQVSVGDEQKIYDVEKVGNHDYVNLCDLCSVLGLQFALDHAKQRIVLIGSRTEAILFLNIFASKINGVYRTVPFSPILIDDAVLFPKELITTFFTKHFNRLVLVRDIEYRPNIKEFNLIKRGDSVVFRFNTEYETEVDLDVEGKKVTLEINGLLTSPKTGKTYPGINFVKNYEVKPFNNYSKFTFLLSDRDVGAILREDEILFTPPSQRLIDIIVIDPGHGGIDPGAVGKKGLYEKDCNLDISLKLKKLLRDSLKVKVVLTREDDSYLSLGARTKIANRNRADLFVSVHCNASKKKKDAAGMETYFLSEAKTDEARATAALENSAIKFDEPRKFDSDLSWILFDLAQSEFLQESSDLAEFIQDEAAPLITIPNRGINQANFYVLNGAFMPAVLVESAFISNTGEEKLLKDSKFRSKLALGIFRGIRKFIEKYGDRRLN